MSYAAEEYDAAAEAAFYAAVESLKTASDDTLRTIIAENDDVVSYAADHVLKEREAE